MRTSKRATLRRLLDCHHDRLSPHCHLILVHPHLNDRLLVRQHLNLHHRLTYTDSCLPPHPLVHLHPFLHLRVTLLLPLLLHLHRHRVPHVLLIHRLVTQHHSRPTCLHRTRLRHYHGQMIRLLRLVVRLRRRIKRFSVSPAPFPIIQAGPKTCWKSTNTSLRDRLRQRKCLETGGKNGRTVWRST